MAVDDVRREVVSDEFGKVETRGIDFIPPEERHGKPRDVFAVWAASNINYLYILLGGLLTVFGLNVWQAMTAVVVGNLFWVAIGTIATSGPVAGAPSSVIMRAMYGTNGNRINVGIFNWPVSIAYEAINLCVGALAGFAVIEAWGGSLSIPTKVAIVIVTSGVTLAISVYGHATILRMSGVFTAVLAAAMVVLGVFVVAHADWGYQPETVLTGGAMWAKLAAGIALIAAAPLSWSISPDYARYLPSDTSAKAVAIWTALGGVIPNVTLAALGVLAGTVIDMREAQTNLAQIVPGWFYPLFLLVIVVGSMANNVLTMYSSGLSLQAVGIPLRRSITVLFDGLLGVALACYALFVSDFTSALSSILELTVIVLGPTIFIYVTDQWLRRNRYDGLALNDVSQNSIAWYTRGFNIAGVAAFLSGAIGAALCVDVAEFSGPIATALGGADLSWLVGPLIASGVYIAVAKRCYPDQFAKPASR
ncbi:cytosine permease [Mycobacterium sp. 21AC1]|uniref:purine-cytosine permease family protein n=1 Tax=[Mycobacterium] appelbergii TaxID=2939269 RepID=UPI0029390855|nr:cytosine permease [Mycobacterium sp. 21AC1]MDV3125969.1 cytosine permease [Mycobacterium sp. 21AC1]